MLSRRNLMGGSLLLAAPFVLRGSRIAQSQESDITIGLVGPMTGPAAAIGQYMRNGANVAVEYLNAKGGVLGRQLRIHTEDDVADPRNAVSTANKSWIMFLKAHLS